MKKYAYKNIIKYYHLIFNYILIVYLSFELFSNRYVYKNKRINLIFKSDIKDMLRGKLKTTQI